MRLFISKKSAADLHTVSYKHTHTHTHTHPYIQIQIRSYIPQARDLSFTSSSEGLKPGLKSADKRFRENFRLSFAGSIGSAGSVVPSLKRIFMSSSVMGEEMNGVRRVRRFAPLRGEGGEDRVVGMEEDQKEVGDEEGGLRRLRGIVFDMDGTLWYVFCFFGLIF